RRGYTALFIEDRQSEGIRVRDLLSPETRAGATKVAGTAVAVGQQTAQRLGPELAGRVTTLPKSDEIRRTIAQGVPADAIVQSVSSIVDEVLDGPTVLGLTSIKAQDSFAYSHAVEVASVAVMIGRKMGFRLPDLKRLGRGALLHAIGQTFPGDPSDGK